MAKDMTTKQFNTAIESLDLTVVGTAPYIGLSPRQTQRIAAGAPVPAPVAKLLRLVQGGLIKLDDLKEV